MFMSIYRKESHKLPYSALGHKLPYSAPGNLSCFRLHAALLQLSILLQQLNHGSTQNKIQANVAPLASYCGESTEILHWNPRDSNKQLDALALFDTGVYMFQVVSDFIQRLQSSWIPLTYAWLLGVQKIEQKPVMMCWQKQSHLNCIITRWH